MTPEQLVPTLEVCQQLKAAGFPQDTAFSWGKTKDDWGKDFWRIAGTYLTTESDSDRRWNDHMTQYTESVAAPTAGELEEWLIEKGTIEYILSAMDEVGIMYSPDKRVNNCRSVRAHTLIAALAALVLEVAG